MLSASPITLLERRTATMGSTPLWTMYDVDQARVELSGLTVANWANKISWFLEDEGIDAGQRVELRVAAARPLHWMTLVWVLGCWQAGVTPSLVEGDLVVVDAAHLPRESNTPTVVASMHPFGLGVADLPTGYIDCADVRTQPDAHRAEPLAADFAVWQDSTSTITLGDLDLPSGPAERTLSTASDPWQAIVEAILTPLATGGAVVLVEAGDLARIRADERTR